MEKVSKTVQQNKNKKKIKTNVWKIPKTKKREDIIEDHIFFFIDFWMKDEFFLRWI